MNQYKKALVTGGAGFIGSHLAKKLLAQGMQVTVLDDLSMGKEENIPDGAVFIRGDIRFEDDMMRALDGVDIVFHEAARVSIRSSLKEFYDDADTNFMGTLNLLKCCADSGIKKIVFASSMAVYADSRTPDPIAENYTPEPIAPYGIAKLAAEKYCLQLAQQAGIDCIVLRYFNTYGKGQTFTPYVGVITIFIRKLLQNEQPMIYGDGEQKRDFVHVDDIVSANVLAMQSSVSHGIYNVGTSKATSVNEIADILCKKINPDIKPYHVEQHSGELRYSIAGIDHISNELGYKPSFEIIERIDEVIDYYRD